MVSFTKLFTLFALVLSFQVIASQENFLDFDMMADREENITTPVISTSTESKEINFDEMADREDQVTEVINNNNNESTTSIENMTEESLSPEAQRMIENIESHLGYGFGLSEVCKNELLGLKLVIDVIKSASGADEKIFYGVKTIVDKFAGLKANCSVPLPIISTANWSFEKFKQAKCAIAGVSFAASASTCLSGGIFSCAAALSSLKSLATCVKLVNMS
jgi:hypothetical protein